MHEAPGIADHNPIFVQLNVDGSQGVIITVRQSVVQCLPKASRVIRRDANPKEPHVNLSLVIP
ncbi:MAG: hypothetical protein R6T87_07540 [Marinobacter sp.]